MLTGNLTMKQCKKQGLNVIKVVTQEDVSNAPRENADDRRGLVGCIPAYKIAGAAAAEGKSWQWRYGVPPIRPQARPWRIWEKRIWRSAWDSTVRAAADVSL